MATGLISSLSRVRGFAVALFPLSALISFVLGIMVGLNDTPPMHFLQPFVLICAFSLLGIFVLIKGPIRYEERSTYPVHRLFLFYVLVFCLGASLGWMALFISESLR